MYLCVCYKRQDHLIQIELNRPSRLIVWNIMNNIFEEMLEEGISLEVANLLKTKRKKISLS